MAERSYTTSNNNLMTIACFSIAALHGTNYGSTMGPRLQVPCPYRPSSLTIVYIIHISSSSSSSISCSSHLISHFSLYLSFLAVITVSLYAHVTGGWCCVTYGTFAYGSASSARIDKHFALRVYFIANISSLRLPSPLTLSQRKPPCCCAIMGIP